MGTRLGATVSRDRQWNGMGGSGELMADSLICMLRDLSPQLKGPIRAGAADAASRRETLYSHVIPK